MNGKPGGPRKFNDKEKWCPGCLSWKVFDDFCVSRRSPSGRANRCRSCRASKYDPIRARAYAYGISKGELIALWERQNRGCAICHRPIPLTGPSSHLDHNHETGQVRGLLCNFCNHALGLVFENPQILQSAIEYIRSWGVLCLSASLDESSYAKQTTP
jgi:hypothetical protein